MLYYSKLVAGVYMSKIIDGYKIDNFGYIIVPTNSKIFVDSRRTVTFKSRKIKQYFKAIYKKYDFLGNGSDQPIDNFELLSELYLSRLANLDFGLTTPIYYPAKYLTSTGSEYIGVVCSDYTQGYSQVDKSITINKMLSPTIRNLKQSKTYSLLTNKAKQDLNTTMFFDYITAQGDRSGANLAFAKKDKNQEKYDTTIVFDYGNTYLSLLRNYDTHDLHRHLDENGKLFLGIDTPMASYETFLDEVETSTIIKSKDVNHFLDKAIKSIKSGTVKLIGEELEDKFNIPQNPKYELMLTECMKYQAERLDKSLEQREKELC